VAVLKVRVKGLDIYIPLLTLNDQQRLTILFEPRSLQL